MKRKRQTPEDQKGKQALRDSKSKSTERGERDSSTEYGNMTTRLTLAKTAWKPLMAKMQARDLDINNQLSRQPTHNTNGRDSNLSLKGKPGIVSKHGTFTSLRPVKANKGKYNKGNDKTGAQGDLKIRGKYKSKLSPNPSSRSEKPSLKQMTLSMLWKPG